VLGIEVLDKHKSEAGVGGQMFQQFRKRLQAAGGCADADDRKAGGGTRLRRFARL
jgi:hypothetical protein